MSDEKCVTCGIAVVEGADFCHACGTEFSTKVKGKGPFTSNFAEVKSVYVPSGKTTPRAVALMVVTGIVLIPILGIFAFGIDRIISEIALALARIIPLLGILAGFVMWIFGGLLLGMLGAYLLSLVSKLGKNRSPKIAGIIGGAAGLGGGMALLFWRVQFLGEIGDNSIIDLAKVVCYGVAMTLGGWQHAVSTVKEQFFCEGCGEFMKQKTTRVHQGEEQRLHELLSTKAFAEIGGSLVQTKDSENVAIINFSTCPDCGDGCVELTSVQTRTTWDKNNTAKKETRRKLILSMMVSAEEAQALAAQLQPA